MNTWVRISLVVLLGSGMVACSANTSDDAASSEAELRGGKAAADGGDKVKTDKDKTDKDKTDKDKTDKVKTDKPEHSGQAGEHGGGKDRDGSVDEDTATDEDTTTDEDTMGGAGAGEGQGNSGGSKGGKSAEHMPVK